MTGARRREGLTLVEAALLIAILGSLLAIFLPTFIRHLRTTKTSEAAERLQDLHQRAAAYFVASHPLADGTLGWSCLPEQAGPAPAEPSEDRVEVDFDDPDTPGHATWDALDFQPDEPLRYRYTFLPEQSGCDLRAPDGEPILTLRAEGDLDGDGTFSTYERQATISEDGELIPTGILHIRHRME